MARGYSLTAFAGLIRVPIDTVYEWVRAQPDFSHAVHCAKPARVMALETKLLTATRGAQAATSIFALKNADPNEWKEVRNVQHVHAHQIHKLSMAQLHEIAARGQRNDGVTIEGEYRKSEENVTSK